MRTLKVPLDDWLSHNLKLQCPQKQNIEMFAKYLLTQGLLHYILGDLDEQQRGKVK